jgi:hypothetical protein
MTLFVSLIVISTDTFSEPYCQPRAYSTLLILMATCPMTLFWNIENVSDCFVVIVWKLGLYIPMR